MADNGAEQLHALAGKLRGVGGGSLRRELAYGLEDVARPLVAKVAHSAYTTLPRHGGLNRIIAATPVTVRVKLGGDPAVTLTGRNGTELDLIDAGIVRHSTFGHAPVVSQRVTPGWWTRPLAQSSPAVGRAVGQVVDDVSRRLEARR